MKIVDGKCPYCDEPIKEKPGRIAKQINCQSCGRLLNLPSIFTSSNSDSEDLRTLEPGLVCTFLVGLGFTSGSTLSFAIMIGCGFVLMVLLWSQEDVPGMPDSLRARAIGTSERLRIFPFELYLVFGWVILLLLSLFKFHHAAGMFYSFLMFLAAVMALQSNRLLKESKVTSSKVSLLDFNLFFRVLINPSKAFGRRKTEKGEGESFSTEHFTLAAAEKSEKEQLRAENFEEIARRRSLCLEERKSWERDIQERYSQWLDEEAARLQNEK